MMAKTSADLWFRPTTPLGVAAEDAGAFGTVREPVGVDAKKKHGTASALFFQIYLFATQLREPAHIQVQLRGKLFQ